MVAFTEAVEIVFGRVAFQFAEHHKLWNRHVTQSQTVLQGIVHCLLIVHLTIAHRVFTLAIAFTIATCNFDEVFVRYKVKAYVPNIPACNGLGVCMLTYQLQLWRWRAR